MSDERYEIKGKLGEGGVGAVYKAFDTQLNREVAIKRVLADGNYDNKEEATKHLLKEATALSSVQHPHIVTVYDAGVDDDGPYVVMELIHGKTLDEMVERGTLTWNDLREIALQSQEALIAAQELDLVHRDLKPSNVMVCWLPSGKFQVKIVDFGLAKFSAAPSLQTIDHGDAVFGSIFFMAPEQFERTPLDKRTDMYAMGCLYYFALTGECPFNGETAASVMASHLQHHVTPLHELRPDIPRWGADWVMWHIERSMDARPTDARSALERFLVLDKQATQPVTAHATPATAATPGTQQFVFPGNATGPQQPHTGQVAVHETATQDVNALNPKTAPQPIAPPKDGEGKASPHTQAQQMAKEATAAQQLAAAPATALTAAQIGLPTVDPATQPVEGITNITAPSEGFTLSKRAKLLIFGTIAIVAVVIGLVAMSILGERNETKLINDLMVEAKALDDGGRLQDGIEVNEKQLLGVLRRATSVEDNKQRPILLKVLAYAKPEDDDLDINAKIIEHVTSAECPENIRTDIFKSVMTRRKNVANIPALLEYARNSSEETAAAAAIKAAHASALGQSDGGFINDFLSLINETNSSAVRGAAERVASDLISQSKNKSQFDTPIIGAYETAITTDAKYAMLRLSGTAGGSKAAKAIKAALKSNDAALQNAAITALGQWANHREFKTLTEFIDTTDSDSLRKRAFDAAYSFLRTRNEDKSINHSDLWQSLSDVTTQQREKLQIISGMANQKDRWALSILDKFIKDKDEKVLDQAEKAKAKLERRIRENRR